MKFLCRAISHGGTVKPIFFCRRNKRDRGQSRMLVPAVKYSVHELLHRFDYSPDSFPQAPRRSLCLWPLQLPPELYLLKLLKDSAATEHIRKSVTRHWRHVDVAGGVFQFQQEPTTACVAPDSRCYRIVVSWILSAILAIHHVVQPVNCSFIPPVTYFQL